MEWLFTVSMPAMLTPEYILYAYFDNANLRLTNLFNILHIYKTINSLFYNENIRTYLLI